jgi:hypothetical protein
MIQSGEKREEYRELKPYWHTRLYLKNFDVIVFRNGYSKDAPSMCVQAGKIRIGRGNPKWGAPVDKDVWIIPLRIHSETQPATIRGTQQTLHSARPAIR